jgi:hypothetical protein
LAEQNVTPPDPIDYTGIHKFYTIYDALKAINNIENAFVIALIGYSMYSYKIFKALSNKNIPYCIDNSNIIPIYTRGILEKVFDINSLNMRKIMNYCFLRIPNRYLGIQGASLLFAGGEKSTICGFPKTEHTEIVTIHTHDYDLFMAERNKPIEEQSKTVVFLDQYIPFHPDYLYINKSPDIAGGNYYKSLCKFFELLENNYGIEIIIAAHPRSHYDKMPDIFEGRKTIKGRTIELIHQSKFVILHYTTAINMAVLFNKPMLFITTNDIERSSLGSFIRTFTSLFNKTPINIDKPLLINWEKELFVNKEAYQQYINDYIKMPGSPDIPFWEIVAERLKNYDRT